MGKQGLSCVREITPLPRGELLGRKKNVSKEEMSENETRDGDTACELGVHIQVEKTEISGASFVFLLWFF